MSTAILPELTAEGAERLSGRISARLDAIADNYVAVMPLIREALNRNAHAVLGYASPGVFIKDRFGDALSKLGIEVRREVVRELSNAGLSTRAIAPVVGVDQKTVVRDIAGEAHASPAADSIDRDVAEAAAAVLPSEMHVDASTGEVLDTPTVTETTETFKTKVTVGLDGKNYPHPAASPQRRSSLIEEARNAGWNLRKAVERLERIQQDDRFSKNKVEILAALQPHLDFANEVISDL